MVCPPRLVKESARRRFCSSLPSTTASSYLPLFLSLSVPLSSPSGAVDAIKRTAAVCARMLPLPRSRGRRLQKTKVGCVGVHPTAFRCQGQRWLPTKAMKNTLNNTAEKRLDAWSVVVSCFSFGHGEQNKKTAFCFYVFFKKKKNSS